MTAYPTAPPHYPYTDRDDNGGDWLLRGLLLSIIGGVLLLIVLLAAVVAYQQTYRAAILPGVRAGDVDLAGLTPAAAASALDERFHYDESAIFTFRLPGEDRFWQASARDLGVSFDADATVQTAFAVGRSGSGTPDLPRQALTWLNGASIAPVIRYDQAAALTRLAAIAAEIDRPAGAGALVIDGLNVQSAAPTAGRTLDVPSTLAALEAAILDIDDGGGLAGAEIMLVIRESAPAVAGVEDAAARAQMALSAPLMLTATAADGTPLTWTIPPAQIAGLIGVVSSTAADGVTRYDVTADAAPYRPALEALAPGLIVPAQDGRFGFDAAAGQLIPLQPAVHGRRLDIDGTLAALNAALFSPARTVPLVFIEERPLYFNGVTAAELGITTLIGEGVSSYAGSSEARLTNIRVGVSRFNGVIVPPGQLFSFNDILGDVSPEAGFVQSAVIFGGRTILGDGGGVCQVSTTLFRAAFFGGYPIAERWAHGYRVGFYENGDPLGSGMDAAIYVGELDFKFINDTPHHILIDAAVVEETGQVRFRLYSTSVGRVVEHEGPMMRDLVDPLPTRYEVNPDLALGDVRQVDTAIQGAYVEVTRIVRDQATGTEIDREIIASQYQPWGAIYQVAPGDPRAG